MSNESCKAFEGQLAEYADGELDTKDRAKVNEHLEKCAECRRVLEEYRQSLSAVVEGVAEPPPGEGVVLESIRQRAQEKRLWRRRRRLAFSLSACAMTACLLLAVGITGQLRRGQPTKNAIVTAQEEIAELNDRIVSLERRLDQLKAASETTVLDRAQLEYEEVAAICFAAGFNLEQNLGNVEEALNRYRYAVEHFPETAAAQKARERIEQLTNKAV